MARPKRGAKKRGTPSRKDTSLQRNKDAVVPTAEHSPDIETTGKRSKVAEPLDNEINAAHPTTVPLTESTLHNRPDALNGDQPSNTVESPIQTSTMSVAGSVPSLSQLKGASSLSNYQLSEDNGSRIVSPNSDQLSDEDDVGDNPMYKAAEGLSPSSVSALNCEGHKVGIGYKRAMDEQLPGTIGQRSNNQERNVELSATEGDKTPTQKEQSSNSRDNSSIRMANTAAEASASSGPGDLAEDTGGIGSSQLGESDRAELAAKMLNHSTAEVDPRNPTHIGANLPRDAGGDINLSMTGDASVSSEAQSDEKEIPNGDTVQQGEDSKVLERTRETLQRMIKCQERDATNSESDGRRAPPPSESMTLSGLSRLPPRTKREHFSSAHVRPFSCHTKERFGAETPLQGDEQETGCDRILHELSDTKSNEEKNAWYRQQKPGANESQDAKHPHAAGPASVISRNLDGEKLPWIVEVPGSRFYRLPWPLKNRAEAFRVMPKAHPKKSDI